VAVNVLTKLDIYIIRNDFSCFVVIKKILFIGN